MEDFNKLWQQRLDAIREKIDPRIFNTWFRPVTFDSYDPAKNTLTLRVPSAYVYEYLELYQSRALQWMISGFLKEGWQLNYRILQSVGGHPADFVLDPYAHRTFLKTGDARQRMEAELGKRSLRWQPAYDAVSDWLTDNKGRGLLCIGTTRTGKSVICCDVLPAVIQQQGIVKCNATEMASRINELLRARCVIIDDLGKDDIKRYGQLDRSFYKLCDAAERNGILMIITTNLSTTPVNDPRYPESIERRYGPEVLSRLRATTKVVIFEDPDMHR